MRLEHLEYLVVVADSGSISAAAERLHISQPSLSAAISNIEAHYHLQIFSRTRAGVQLTERGRLFLRRVRNALASLSELESFSGGDVSGVLRVASVPGVNASIMPAAIAGFSLKYPNVQIELEEMGSHAVKQHIDDNSFAVGLCSTRDFKEFDTSDYFYHHLFNGRVVACTTPEHPLTAYSEISVSNLGDYSIVIFNRSFRMYSYVVSLLEKSAPPHIILTTSNAELAKQTILQTNSVGFFSNVLLSNDPLIQGGKLLTIPLKEEKGTDFIALQKRSQSSNQLAFDFVREVRKQAKRFTEFNNLIGA